MDARGWADAIAERIHCYDIADWLDALAAWLEVSLSLPADTATRVVDAPLRGIALTLARRRDADANRDDIVLKTVTFDAERAALPFGLRAAAETPESARARLSHDTVVGHKPDPATGGTRISYFLPDARVIVLTFGANGGALRRVEGVRLGGPIKYPERSR